MKYAIFNLKIMFVFQKRHTVIVDKHGIFEKISSNFYIKNCIFYDLFIQCPPFFGIAPCVGTTWKESARSKIGTNSFSLEGAKLWNSCPEVIKHTTSVGIAKNEIKKHFKTLQL